MPRVTLTSVAAALGVSAMTVSRALRGRPGLSDELRDKIRATAKRMGYRPDPEIGRLMHHLRYGGKLGFHASLCALTDFTKESESNYCTRVHRHALERARELGFDFSLIRVSPARGGWAAALRTVHARGAGGVLLLPLIAPTALESADWGGVSVVAATSSIVSPRFHEVAPNHAANARLLVEQLVARGFRRLGFVGPTTHSQRTRDAFPAALAWHHSQGGVSFAPLFYEPDSPPKLAPWLRRERPDVVIVGHPPDLPVFKSETARAKLTVRWVLANSRPFNPSAPGLDERADLVGAVAIDTLASLVTRGERGVPAVSNAISITGNWSDPA